MAFPGTTPTTQPAASAFLSNQFANAGGTNSTPFDRLTNLEQIVGNLLSGDTPGPISTYGIGVAAAALSNRVMTSTTTGLADTVATTVLTITVPNAKVNASIRVTLLGSLGAGGTVGAGEGAMTITYDFVIVRTAGVAAIGLISTGFGSATNKVASAATCTVAGALSSVSGGVTATNTFTVTCAITKGSGSSDNHVAVVRAEILNSFGTGITIA